MMARSGIRARTLAVFALSAVVAVGLWQWWLQSSAPIAPPVPFAAEDREAAVVGTSRPDDVAASVDPAPASAPRRNGESGEPRAAGWTLHGHVVDRDGHAIADAAARVFIDVGGVGSAESRIELGEARSGGDGRFTVSLDSLRSLSASASVQALVEVVVDADGFAPDEFGERLDDVIARGVDDPCRFELDAAALVKGRVVTADGRPVPLAEVAILCDAGNDLIDARADGGFALQSPDPQQVVDITMIARHPRHGRSRPLSLRIVPGREARVGDLVLQSVGHRIVGVVRWPDRRPVAGVEVRVERLSAVDDVVFVDGVRVSDYDAMFDDESLECTTDLAGRFVANDRRPGRYRVVVGSVEQPVTVTADRRTTEVEVAFSDPHGVGQIVVRIEDQHGRWLPDAIYTVITWEGERAAAAARRYAAEGVSTELLASAPRRWLHTASDRYLSPRLGSFCLFEAGYHDAGPVYAACRLREGSYREDVRIVLTPRTGGGAVHVVLRDPAGQLLRPVWVRLSRTPGQYGVSIPLPGRVRSGGPEGAIDGPWYELPQDGRIANLPPGPMHLDLLPGVVEGEGEADGLRGAYPVLDRSVQIVGGQTTTVDEQVSPGAPLVVEMRMPAMPSDQRLAIDPVRVEVRSLAAGWTRQFDLLPDDGNPDRHHRTASWRVACRFPLPAGRYQVRCDGIYSIERFTVDDAATGEGGWSISRHLVYAFDETVDLLPQGAPLVVPLTPR